MRSGRSPTAATRPTCPRRGSVRNHPAAFACQQGGSAATTSLISTSIGPLGSLLRSDAESTARDASAGACPAPGAVSTIGSGSAAGRDSVPHAPSSRLDAISSARATRPARRGADRFDTSGIGVLAPRGDGSSAQHSKRPPVARGTISPFAAPPADRRPQTAACRSSPPIQSADAGSLTIRSSAGCVAAPRPAESGAHPAPSSPESP